MFNEFPLPSIDAWRAEVDRLLKGASYEKRLVKKTYEDITLSPLYWEDEGPATLPGNPPYVRGWHAYGDRAWRIAQEVGGTDPGELNARVHAECAMDEGVVNLCLDQAGSWTLDRFKQALSGVDCQRHPVFVQAGLLSLPLLLFYSLLPGDRATREGAAGFDPLGELVARGELPGSLERALDSMAAATGWAAEHAPRLTTVWIGGSVYHDGGASAVQELAFTLATAVDYLRALEKRGLSPEQASPRFRFSFSLGSRFFMEVAKVRAARLLWNSVLEHSGVPEESRTFHCHGRTSHYTGTLHDPHVNLLRTATQAFSGIVGGVDTIHTASFDAAAGPGDEFSRRIALNTQRLLREESHLGQVIDPAGGSWYVEQLTRQVAEKAWTLFREVEELGGMAEALRKGMPQEAVARTAGRRMQAAARQQEVIVGCNRYPDPTEESPTIPENVKPDPYVGVDKVSPASSIQDLLDRARIGDRALDLMAGIFDGEPAKVAAIPGHRASLPFEILRSAVENHRAAGKNARVFLATLGPVSRYMPRLDFSASFFEVGGFEVIRTEGHDTPAEAVTEALAAQAAVVLICGLDKDYAAGAPEVARAVKKDCPDTQVILAGLPRSEAEKTELEQAGVDRFIHAGADLLEILMQVAEKLEVQS